MPFRVVSIPLWAKADYRGKCDFEFGISRLHSNWHTFADLPVDMHEWQTSNPVSAIAKSGYKAGT